MQASAGVLAEGVPQIPVDQVDVEPVRIEMPAGPAKVGAVVLVVRIADGLEEIGIGSGAADVLGRPGTGTFGAFRVAGQGIEG